MTDKTRKPDRWINLVLAAAVLLYSGYFSLYQIQRHRALWTFVDLMSLEQTLWNTLHGRFMRSTVYPPSGDAVTDFEARRTESRLGTHVQPTLLLLVLPYALLPRSETLLILMSISVGLGAIPLYRIARRRLHSSRMALLFALGYLVLPSIETASGWDIHGTSFLPPLLLAGLDAAESGRRGWWWLWILLAMGCREDIPFLAGWAMLWLVPRDRRKAAVLMFVLGLGWSFLNFAVIIPHFGGGGTPYLTHFLPPGTALTIQGIWDALLRHPEFWWVRLVSFAAYNVRLATPLLAMYIFHWPTLLAIAPQLVLNGFSIKSSALVPSSSHYSLPIMPWVLFGSVAGFNAVLRFLSQHWPNFRWRNVLAMALAVSIGAAHGVDGYTFLNRRFLWPHLTGQESAAKAALAQVPLAASASLEMHLAAQSPQRETVRIFSDVRDVDWIALNVWYGEYPYQSQSYNEAWSRILTSSDWETVLADSGLVLLRRGQGPPLGILKAFEVPESIPAHPLAVRFGEGEKAAELRAFSAIPLPMQSFVLCMDWYIPAGVDRFSPLVQVVGVAVLAQPTVGVQTFPDLYATPGQWRDCTRLRFRPNASSTVILLSAVDAQGAPASVHIVDGGAWGELVVDRDDLVIKISDWE